MGLRYVTELAMKFYEGRMYCYREVAFVAVGLPCSGLMLEVVSDLSFSFFILLFLTFSLMTSYPKGYISRNYPTLH